MNQPIVNANIEVHTQMASSYNSNEPHFRPENRAKVRDKLANVRRRVAGGRLLDLGCGTGFILDLATEFFDELHGVDVTQAMLDQVDLSLGKTTLHRATAEKLPFSDDVFDVVTAYSFIHHTANYVDVLKEAYRVLKPGGAIYIDLEPNRRFWEAINQVSGDESVSSIVRREVDSVLHTDERVEEEFGIPAETFNQAEYTKAVLGGIDPDELRSHCVQIGFSDVEVNPGWFLAQGTVMHTDSFELAERVDEYLRELGPLAIHLYKYLECTAIK